jgi:hypothetical protein
VANEKVTKIVLKVEGEPTDQAAASAAKMQAALAQVMIEKTAQSASKLNESILSFQYATQDFENASTSGRGGARAGAGRPRKPPKPSNRPPAPPNPKAPPIVNPPPGDDVPEQASRLAKALKALQKVVTAVDGTNGHTTKTLAVVNRSYQYLSKTLTQATKATAQAGATTTAAASATAGAAKTTAVATGSLGAFGAAALLAGKVVGVMAVAFIGATVAAKLFTRIIENLQEVVGEFSGALQQAKAQTKVAEMQAQMRAAGNVGGDLVSLENTNREIKTALIDAKSEMIELLEPFLKLIGDTIVAILELMNIILLAMNTVKDMIEWGFESVLSLLAKIPFIGKVAGIALEWMQQDEIDKVKAASLNVQVEELFDQKNFFPTNLPKDSIASRFLP